MKRKVDQYFLPAIFFGIFIMSVLVGGTLALAQTSVPHVFIPDTPAKANENPRPKGTGYSEGLKQLELSVA